MALTSCSNPSGAPATSSTTGATYSASTFFNTEALGDTTKIPFPYCFPVTYLQQQLGLTDSQATAIQAIQDSLRLAIKARLDAMKAAGTLTPDSVRAVRLEFQTELYKDISGILTAAQLAQLQALTPPRGPGGHFDGGRGPGGGGPGGRGPGRREPDNDGDDSARVAINPKQMDSVMLVRLEQSLTNAGDPLTADQIALIQNAAVAITADTTLTPDGRRAAMQAQLQTILTAKQIADVLALRGGENAEHRRHH